MDTGKISVKKLFFDSQNPRLVESEDAASQEDIMRTLWRVMAVDEIAMSIAANGYFEHEPLFVTKENEKYIVIEGNRRLAAVKLLLDDRLRRELKATDLPGISDKRKNDLKQLPVIHCKRKKIWEYVGFKHVNGPQQWSSYSKASYIARVCNKYNVSLEKIAKQIGDRHSTVVRLYRALMVLEQAESKGVYMRSDSFKKKLPFSHLTTGLDSHGFQEFLKLPKEKSDKKNPVPNSKVKNLGELCEWLFGSKSKDQEPVIKSQNPDLRNLAEVLKSPNGIAALRRGLPLGTSLDISKGDERLFREAMVAAKQSLEEARGKMLTGYEGEKDLLDTASAINKIAENIFREMEDISNKRHRKKTRAN